MQLQLPAIYLKTESNTVGKHHCCHICSLVLVLLLPVHLVKWTSDQGLLLVIRFSINTETRDVTLVPGQKHIWAQAVPL